MKNQPWSDRLSADVKSWSDHVAALAVDALVDAGLIELGDFEKATAIAAEEILVRLCLHDYPPTEESDLPPSESPKENTSQNSSKEPSHARISPPS